MLAVCTFIVAQLFSNQSKRIEDDGLSNIKGKGKVMKGNKGNQMKEQGRDDIMMDSSTLPGDH